MALVTEQRFYDLWPQKTMMMTMITLMMKIMMTIVTTKLMVILIMVTWNLILIIT